jgi:CDP-4-dehydro-6-deoxyglucose reductase
VVVATRGSRRKFGCGLAEVGLSPYSAGGMAMQKTVELVEATALSPGVKAFTFRMLDGAPLEYAAGQWLNFDIPTQAGVVRRAYSIASAPDGEHPDRFEIAVTRVEECGVASIALHDLALGARLEVDGPHGFFTREENARALPALLVATGTGVCPFRAMLQDELRNPNGPPLRLLFGCRSEADILFRSEFDTWAATVPRFSLHVTLSQPSAAWSGLRGYVQRHLPVLIDANAKPHVYVCGLTKMVSEVRRVLKDDLGYDRRWIHSERYD